MIIFIQKRLLPTGIRQFLLLLEGPCGLKHFLTLANLAAILSHSVYLTSLIYHFKFGTFCAELFIIMWPDNVYGFTVLIKNLSRVHHQVIVFEYFKPQSSCLFLSKVLTHIDYTPQNRTSEFISVHNSVSSFTLTLLL